jgi:GNAT superfamily N-acetyltransferase
LSRLVVAASARRLGIGQILVGHCHEVARAAGWHAIALWSRRYQTAAHHLYESLGYRRVPHRDETDASGHERLVFRLPL